MTSEEAAAHQRLLQVLPVRDHIGCGFRDAGKGQGKKKSKPTGLPGEGAVFIHGIKYKSRRAACEQLAIHRDTLNRMLKADPRNCYWVARRRNHKP
jgi:hypothetical protein